MQLQEGILAVKLTQITDCSYAFWRYIKIKLDSQNKQHNNMKVLNSFHCGCGCRWTFHEPKHGNLWGVFFFFLPHFCFKMSQIKPNYKFLSIILRFNVGTILKFVQL